MGFWEKLRRGLAFFAAVSAVALQMEVIGAQSAVPSAFVSIQGRRFRIDAVVTREA